MPIGSALAQSGKPASLPAIKPGTNTSSCVDQAAASLDNPDHVAITIHNYRWQQALAEGEAKYFNLEKKLAPAPGISVPTITMEGDDNGSRIRRRVSTPRNHRQIFSPGSDRRHRS